MAMGSFIELTADFLPSSSQVAGFVGREGLSELYRFRIGVLTSTEDLDLSEARGQAASLRIEHGHGAPHIIQGMVAEAGLLHAWGGRALYELIVVPHVWALTLKHMSRVFVDMSVPEIVEELLEQSDIGAEGFEVKIQGSYFKHPHTSQYKESRWAFISRLLEREGLYYFFEHGDNGEKLIISDHKSLHESSPSAPLRYIPLSGPNDAMSAEAFSVFRSSLTSLPAATRLRDFDYLNPKLDVVADASIAGGSGAHHFHVGDHDFRAPDVAQPLADAAAQAWLARECRYQGRGRVMGIRSGYRFTLSEHPIDTMNREYLAVSAVHSATHAANSSLVRDLLGLRGDGDDYRVDVEAIAAATQYRTPFRTPVPNIASVERAIIDGPADSEYGQIDEHGRYKVKFHFDTDDSALGQGKASTWLRMLQPHGGEIEGFHFPLRKGTEVLVVFLGGNPDRPVIAGALPNALRPSPVTSENHTQNVVQTGGHNRMEMEDEKGQQYFDISTPPKDSRIHLGEPHGEHSHYIVFNTEGDQLVNIGGNKDIEVGGEQKEHVAGSLTETYDTDRTETVTGPVNETYTGPHNTTVAGARAEEVCGCVTELYNAAHQSTVGGARTETLQATETVTVAGLREINAGGRENHNVTGWFNEVSSGGTKIDAPAIHLIGGSTILLTAPNIQIKGAGSVVIETPDFQQLNPQETWFGSLFTGNWATKVTFTGLSMGATAVKVEVAGIAAVADGLAKKAYGAVTRKIGSETDTKASSNEAAGNKSYLCGLFTVT